MKVQHKRRSSSCPFLAEAIEKEAWQIFEKALRWCGRTDQPFARFETRLFVVIAVLGWLLIRLYLAKRHERLKLQPYLNASKSSPIAP